MTTFSLTNRLNYRLHFNGFDYSSPYTPVNREDKIWTCNQAKTNNKCTGKVRTSMVDGIPQVIEERGRHNHSPNFEDERIGTAQWKPSAKASRDTNRGAEELIEKEHIGGPMVSPKPKTRSKLCVNRNP